VLVYFGLGRHVIAFPLAEVFDLIPGLDLGHCKAYIDTGSTGSHQIGLVVGT